MYRNSRNIDYFGDPLLCPSLMYCLALREGIRAVVTNLGLFRKLRPLHDDRKLLQILCFLTVATEGVISRLAVRQLSRLKPDCWLPSVEKSRTRNSLASFVA